MGSHQTQDKDSTLYIGNLDERCTDALVWELLLQVGRIVNVHLPRDRVSGNHQGFGFVEFGSEEDADYAAKIMNQIRLWGKPIRVNKASADKRNGGAAGTGIGGEGSGSVGAELFIGNLDPLADEKTLYDTFSRFGPLIAPPKIARDDATNLSKGYGFVSYADFSSSDDAVESMHGSFLMNKEVSVQYAYKRDGKGERHGDQAERLLAAQAAKHGVQMAVPAMPAALSGVPVAPTGPQGISAGGYGGYAQGGSQNAGPSQRAPQPPPGFNYGGQPQSQYPQQQQQQVPGYGAPWPPPQQNGYYNAMPPSATPYMNAHLPPPQHMNGVPGAPLPNRNYNNQSPLTSAPLGAGLPARPPPSQIPFQPPGLQQGFQPLAPPPGFMPPGPPQNFAPPQGVWPPPPPPPGAFQQR
ncbi:hypothetical protein LTR62_008612 [Meristemomyces frigidus]|uniref:RRM domain-containing protein n=1 Tax=Meristemomyces frigidus TaxID=1508187 RepID=A0AAN7TAW5_9PEZI|nr:hypothetical protein LTR62_008612 [Meristemomyces frigidus]